MKKLLTIGGLAWPLVLIDAQVRAQGSPASDAVQTQVGRAAQTVPGGLLAVAAYLVLWGLVFGVVVLTMNRQKRVDADLAELDSRLDDLSQGK